MILIVVFGLMIAAFAAYHAIRYIKGSKKHHIRFVNIVLVAVAVTSFVLMEIDHAAIKSKSESPEYFVFNGTLLYSFNYVEEKSGYYLFTSHSEYSLPQYYAVETSKVKLPLISRIYSPVAIYLDSSPTEGAKSGTSGTVEIGDRRYSLVKDGATIVPDYFSFFVCALIITAVVLFLYDYVVIKKYLKEKNQDSNE